MGPQSNPDSVPPEPELAPAESPSADDLLALIPDMELLETSAEDALAAHVAVAASAAGRKPDTTPTLTTADSAATLRVQAMKPVINDDPYADQMPELDAYAATIPVARAVPPISPGGPSAPPATSRVPQAPAPTRAAQPARTAPVATPAAPASATPKPAAPRPAVPTPRPAVPAAAPASARKPPNPQTVVPPVMDREFIARNRIVELYLSGGLPVRGATIFERFCRENPQILDEIGLPERVHAGLRLLEASGKPEPWQEKPTKFWERPYVPVALSALVVLLGIIILVLNGQLSDQTRKVGALQKLVVEQPLDAAATSSTLNLLPTHAGPNAAIAAVIGGASAQLVNIKIDMTHSDFRAFRITIDRVDQGRVAVLNNLIKDSNAALGFSLNTSALGAGNYQLTIEGLDWRGDPQPDSWAAITIRH
jgi:hypothetical protein